MCVCVCVCVSLSLSLSISIHPRSSHIPSVCVCVCVCVCNLEFLAGTQDLDTCEFAKGTQKGRRQKQEVRENPDLVGSWLKCTRSSSAKPGWSATGFPLFFNTVTTSAHTSCFFCCLCSVGDASLALWLLVTFVTSISTLSPRSLVPSTHWYKTLSPSLPLPLPLSLFLFLSRLFLSTSYSYLLLSRTLLPPTKTASGRLHGHSIVYIPAWATTQERENPRSRQTDRQTNRDYGNNSIP